MDVHRWLQDTIDHAPPGEVREDPPSAFQDPPSVAGSKKNRRKRRRGASDSSIIAPQILGHQPTDLRLAATHGKLLGNSRRSGQNAPRSGSESWRGSSREPARDGDSAVFAEPLPVKTYKRRARHKTKADRYDSKAGKLKKIKQRDEDRGRAARHGRRKSHRSGDGGRTAGLVQSFQLKNGPKNNRLTLNQDVNTGLFRHGRASAQMPGKSNGLPDLIFNEMKFLHRPKEHQDEIAQGDASHEPTTKDKKRRAENEEISTYFERSRRLPDRPVTASDHHASMPPNKQEESRTARHDRSPDRDSSLKLPLENLPKVPFLEFGSRGAIHDSSQANCTATLFSWSESIPRKASARVRTPLAGNQYISTDIAHSRPHKEDPDQEKSRQLHKVSLDDHIEHGQCIPSRRARPSAVVKIYRPGDSAANTRMRRTTSHTSLSLPGISRSDISHTHVRHEEAGSKILSSGKSYGTSDILKVRERMHALAAQPSTRSIDTQSAGHNKENIPVLLPSPTAELLHTAQTALLATKAQLRRRTLNVADHEKAQAARRLQPHHYRQSLRAREDAPHTIDERLYQGPSEPPMYQNVLRPVQPDLFVQNVSPESMGPASSRAVTSYIWTQSLPQYAPISPEDDHEMLLGNHDSAFNQHDLSQLQVHERIHLDAMHQESQHLVEPEETVYENYLPPTVHGQFQWPQDSSMPADIASERTTAMAPQVPRGLLGADESDAEDIMHEFWRPNRLY